MLTMSDVLAQWKATSKTYAQQIEFFENGPGLNPPTPLETIRQWKAELDSLIAQYEKDAV